LQDTAPPDLPKDLAWLIGARDDSDLVVGLRRKDPESLGLLYDRYGPAAYSLAIRSLGDRVRAEAAVAEAMLKCWNRIALLKESRGSALGIWLLLTTHESALEQLRAERTMESGLMVGGALFQDWSKGLDGERVQEAFLALQQLNAAERETLQAAFFEGLSAAELGLRLGRTQAEVERLVEAGLSKLTRGQQE
jgi:RNA polymerase sigma-70 factor (ECF subfamily)